MLEQVIDANESTISDTQINKAFEYYMNSVENRRIHAENLQIMVAPIPTQEVALAVIPTERQARQRYPSRSCKSPYLVNDIRAAPDSFDEYISSPAQR